jgi:germination protein M
MVVVKLIKGPSDSSVFATLPADMKLLNVSVNNGVCYVNLDSSFLTEMVNVSSEIPIYSIVDSLCDLESVDSVKIMVNGDSSKTFRESISLDNTFTFNDTLIGQ